jgi:hypothetical protein
MFFQEDEICEKCNEKYMSKYHAKYKWCRLCHINDLKNNFTNWTSDDDALDTLIQEIQLEINEPNDMILEWIPYNQFNDIKEIVGEESDKVYLAIWKDGPLNYNKNKKEYIRINNNKVVLKLYNLQDLIDEFFIDQVIVIFLYELNLI